MRSPQLWSSEQSAFSRSSSLCRCGCMNGRWPMATSIIYRLCSDPAAWSSTALYVQLIPRRQKKPCRLLFQCHPFLSKYSIFLGLSFVWPKTITLDHLSRTRCGFGAFCALRRALWCFHALQYFLFHPWPRSRPAWRFTTIWQTFIYTRYFRRLTLARIPARFTD